MSFRLLAGRGGSRTILITVAAVFLLWPSVWILGWALGVLTGSSDALVVLLLFCGVAVGAWVGWVARALTLLGGDAI
jgi:hypothetical protein